VARALDSDGSLESRGLSLLSLRRIASIQRANFTRISGFSPSSRTIRAESPIRLGDPGCELSCGYRFRLLKPDRARCHRAHCARKAAQPCGRAARFPPAVLVRKPPGVGRPFPRRVRSPQPRSRPASRAKRDPMDSMEPVPLALCSSVPPTWHILHLLCGDRVSGTNAVFAGRAVIG
jgi:hypothetical protein